MLLVDGITPLPAIEKIHHWENRPFIGKWPEPAEVDHRREIRKPMKKKVKRCRTAFTTDQIKILEEAFAKSNYIDARKRQELAKLASIGDRQIKVWFQNRRMKMKRELSESSSDSETNEQTTKNISSSMSPVQYQLNSATDNFTPTNNDLNILVEPKVNDLEGIFYNPNCQNQLPYYAEQSEPPCYNYPAYDPLYQYNYDQAWNCNENYLSPNENFLYNWQ